jgi:hypothetical protein
MSWEQVGHELEGLAVALGAGSATDAMLQSAMDEAGWPTLDELAIDAEWRNE